MKVNGWKSSIFIHLLLLFLFRTNWVYLSIHLCSIRLLSLLHNSQRGWLASVKPRLLTHWSSCYCCVTGGGGVDYSDRFTLYHPILPSSPALYPSIISFIQSAAVTQPQTPPFSHCAALTLTLGDLGEYKEATEIQRNEIPLCTTGLSYNQSQPDEYEWVRVDQ